MPRRCTPGLGGIVLNERAAGESWLGAFFALQMSDRCSRGAECARPAASRVVSGRGCPMMDEES